MQQAFYKKTPFLTLSLPIFKKFKSSKFKMKYDQDTGALVGIKGFQ